MQFQEFNKQIVKIAKMKLPGEATHLKMAPVERLLELKRFAKKANTARKAGVMALFYPSVKMETYLILILRKTYKGVHSAQVGFPGGKLEPGDTSLEAAALRETEEEVGVPAQSISVIKKLTEIYIPPSNFFVQPFLGVTHTTPRFVMQEEEVEALIEIPFAHFMDEGALTTTIVPTSYASRIEVPAFLLKGHVVWGATAMMLSEVRELLKPLV